MQHHHHQQQQQSPQMFNFPPSQPTNNITTEQIQNYLDENKQLIFAIMENQSLGKLNVCAQYQAQLQKNLMYLAAIADAQPPAPTGTLQPQLPQLGITQQQVGSSGFMAPFSLQPHDHQQHHVQLPQSMGGVMGMRTGGNIQTGQESATHLMMDAHSGHDGQGKSAGQSG